MFAISNPTNLLEQAASSNASSSSSDDDDEYITLGSVVNGRYLVQGVLGEGRFGVVYGTMDVNSGVENVLKVYKMRVLTGPDGQQQRMNDSDQELAFLLHIRQFKYAYQPVPHIHDWGSFGTGQHFMTQERLGVTLESVLANAGGRLPLLQVQHIGSALVHAASFIHKHGWAHCDIKPNNIVFGVNSNTQHVYLIDFGRSKQILDDKGAFLHATGYQRYGGPLWYSSMRGHAKLDLCFGDDLQAVMYLLVHLLKGHLPWLYCMQPDTVQRIKYYTPDDAVYATCPGAWLNAHRYVQTLNYGDWPDYDRMHKLIQSK